MYEPASGRFESLDSYAGNRFNPQSFNKYLYTHADPVNGSDPTGMFESLIGAMATGAIIGGSVGAIAGAANGVYGYAMGYLDAYQARNMALYGLAIGAGFGAAMGGAIYGVAKFGALLDLPPVAWLATGVGTLLGGGFMTWFAGGSSALNTGIYRMTFGALFQQWNEPKRLQKRITEVAQMPDVNLPPELLATVLQAEILDFNFEDFFFDSLTLPLDGDLATAEKHSLGIAQIRIDEIRRWDIDGRGNTPSPMLRDMLNDPDQAIMLLGKLLRFKLNNTNAITQSNFNLANWNNQSYAKRLDTAQAFAGSKDTLASYITGNGNLGALAPKAFEQVRQFGGYAPPPPGSQP